jgi:putative toxin-antitoxin system antitoxin component (TIGR02293 family)
MAKPLEKPRPGTQDRPASPRLRSRPHAYLALLGLRTLDTPRLLERVAAGFSFAALEHFRRASGLSMGEVGELVQIKPRTLSRRKEEERLQPDESDRLVRAARIVGRALDLYEGDARAARQWLGATQLALGGATPLAFARTGVGAREVENLIGRLEEGVLS